MNWHETASQGLKIVCVSGISKQVRDFYIAERSIAACQPVTGEVVTFDGIVRSNSALPNFINILVREYPQNHFGFSPENFEIYKGA